MFQPWYQGVFNAIGNMLSRARACRGGNPSNAAAARQCRAPIREGVIRCAAPVTPNGIAAHT